VRTCEDLSAAATSWGLGVQDSPESWVAAIEHLAQKSTQQLVILFDEVDVLLQSDGQNGQRLAHAFRTLAEERHCCFVFCGGRVLWTALHDERSPLFKLCHVLRLGYLSPRDVGRIVLEPMQEMGIVFEDAGREIQRMVDISAGHPNLVQYVCKQLLTRLSARGDRTITSADLCDIEASRDFSEYVFQVVWGEATALEQLITLLMLNTPSFCVQDVESALQNQGVQMASVDVHQALAHLVLYSVLDEEEQRYRFAAPALPLLITLTQDIEVLTRRTKQNLHSD